MRFMGMAASVTSARLLHQRRDSGVALLGVLRALLANFAVKGFVPGSEKSF